MIMPDRSRWNGDSSDLQASGIRPNRKHIQPSISKTETGLIDHIKFFLVGIRTGDVQVVDEDEAGSVEFG